MPRLLQTPAGKAALAGKGGQLALLRQVTLRARLKVPAPDEVDRIAVYWGARGRSRDVYPLLDAASRGLSTWSISIVLLLPPFPRERLYTYDHATDDAFRDCIWTALNVFNVEEDDRLPGAFLHVVDVVAAHFDPGHWPAPSGCVVRRILRARFTPR